MQSVVINMKRFLRKWHTTVVVWSSVAIALPAGFVIVGTTSVEQMLYDGTIMHLLVYSMVIGGITAYVLGEVLRRIGC